MAAVDQTGMFAVVCPPKASWKFADVLGARGIPNNVEIWGREWGHDWPTWREMLPSYLERKVLG